MNILLGITDHYAPDVQAMMAARYSRSFESILDRLPDTQESQDKHRESLHKYYVGYGHKSVSQLSSTTIWLEGVSQLAAKAIENHPLFNGQESSTRYINYNSQPMYSESSDITDWQERFRAFYIKALPLVVEKIKSEFPFEDNQGDYLNKKDSTPEELTAFLKEQETKKRTTWENTVKARAFDICRGLLPAGCVTNVAFTGTFDTINDHFGEMLYHPLQEMRDIAEQVLTQLKIKYPYAAMDIEKLTDRNDFVTYDFFYQGLPSHIENEVILGNDTLFTHQDNLVYRKKFSKISNYTSSKLNVTLQGEIDFGSYRDIHRHRNGQISMELLSVNRGFHSFYKNELPVDLQNELSKLLGAFESWYKESNLPMEIKQYAVPMGYKVGVVYECKFNQALYIFELRSGKTVHQTLRHLVQNWVDSFYDYFVAQYGPIKIHADMDEENFSLRRGTQTFTDVTT